MLIRHLVSLSFLLILSISLTAQKAEYRIEVAGIRVGTQSVEQINIGSTTKVVVQTKVVIGLGITYEIEYRQTATFKAGLLTESEVTVTRNGKIYSTTTTLWNGYYYIISVDGKEKRLYQKIYYSGTLSYFLEPKNFAYRYSEARGVLEKITLNNEGAYEAQNGGKSGANLYYYNNGILEKSVINDAKIKFEVIKN